MTRKQAGREAKQLFRLCLVDGRLNEALVRQVVQRIVQSGRRGYLILLGQFQRRLKLEYERHTAKVDCAVPLALDLQASIRAELEGLYGAGITTRFGHDPGLIGGMRIQVGSDVYDGSVRSGLAALQKSFEITSANGTR